MELEELREKIDVIDDELAALYQKRMELSKLVAQVKSEKGLAVQNVLREKEIINRVTADADDEMKLFVKQLFETLFETSKAYQRKIVGYPSDIRTRIDEALSRRRPFPIQASVACQGIMGAYSCIAAEKLFKISSVSCFKTWDGVFSAVEKGFCDYGVLPIENSTAGSVNGVYDLMRKHKFFVVRSIKLRVKHYLLAPDGVRVEDVKEIISHEHALSQCSEFLKELGDVRITRCDNTAVAAKIVAESGRKDVACISSKECAGIYGLKVLRAGVNDNDSNYTRFIAISKNFDVFEGAKKTSLALTLAHEAGSLNRVLDKFSTMGLNLTKLESRPIPGSRFEFCFYFDFEANIEDEEIKNLLSEIEQTSENFEFLGAYEEI